MDVCRIPFYTRALLLPDNPPLGFTWTYDDPTFTLCCTFDEDMDTSVIPPRENFAINWGDGWENVDGRVWLTDRTMGFSIGAIGETPASLRLRFYPLSTLLRNAAGIQRGSFNIEGVELQPTAKYDYADPAMRVEVTFPVPMNQAVVPDTDEMIVYDNNVPFEPDAIAWLSATVLELDVTIPGSLEVIDVQLPAATPNLQCALGLTLCPFRLNGIGPI